MRPQSILSLTIVVPLLALAALLPPPARADGPSDDHVRRIGRQLQCPVCPGESVASSGADLAVQMRTDIREKLTEGWTDEQIVQYYVDRYGESILLKPQKRGFAALIWLGAGAAVALGLLVVGSTLVQVLRRDSDDAEQVARVGGMVDEERARYAARLERILQGDERG